MQWTSRGGKPVYVFDAILVTTTQFGTRVLAVEMVTLATSERSGANLRRQLNRTCQVGSLTPGVVQYIDRFGKSGQFDGRYEELLNKVEVC